jgi:transposase
MLLEGANIKLASVATAVLGRSGRRMVEALVGGEQDPEALAEVARGRLRAKLPALRKALEGRLLAHQRVLLQQLLAHIDFLEEALAVVQVEIERCLAPFGQAVALAQTLPGSAEPAATAIIAEVGTTMTRFASDKPLASWAGVCPGKKQSGGKRWSGTTTTGHPYLRAGLAEVAWA